MNRTRLTTALAAAVALSGALAIRSLHAQQTGFKRVELQRHDIGVQGREVVQTRAEFDAGGSIGKHTHPGEEFGYLLEGNLEVQIEGKPAATLKAGDAFFVPAGTVHAAKNVGSGAAKVLATYVVEKGKPLASMIK
jgi:quercetin dioxygenase-like cupin family protein